MLPLVITYALTIQLYMPFDSSTALERMSRYTYSGPFAREKCEAARIIALNTKVSPDDMMKVSECVKIEEGGDENDNRV